MAIESGSELRSTLEALSILYGGLEALRAECEDDERKLRFLAEGPLDEIRRLETELENYAANFGAGPRVSLWMTLSGGLARWAETPSRLLTSSLVNLRRAVQSITNFDLSSRTSTRPSRRVIEASDPDVVFLQPGSFSIGLRWYGVGQIGLFEKPEEVVTQRALESFFGAIQEVETLGANALTRLEPQRRRILLRAVRDVAPSARSEFDLIGFSGPCISSRKPLVVSLRTRSRAVAALHEVADTTEVAYAGEVRELDLDHKTFKLRDVDVLGEISCIAADLDFRRVVECAVGERNDSVYRSRRVRIFGRRDPSKKQTRLIVHDLEPIEREEELGGAD